MAASTWSIKLLEWFSENGRSMPWREDPHPYRVWVSEVMLQQTQVQTVIPYFNRFMRHFPDVDTLANAHLDDVLKCWEGLGYYSRARRLHNSAKIIQQSRKGHFPTTAKEWQALPGIGDYTAAAIASIAFLEPVPALDGNVLRVGARYLGIAQPVQSPVLRERLYRWLLPQLRHVNPSAFNQAMMECGALICRPLQPLCQLCPLRKGCKARQQRKTSSIPVKRNKPKVPHTTEVVLVIFNRQGSMLVQQRPHNGLLGGMWEFPSEKRKGNEPFVKTQQRCLAGLSITTKADMKQHRSFKHAFSHFTQTLHVFTCTIAKDSRLHKTTSQTDGVGKQPIRWCSVTELRSLAFSASQRSIASSIEEQTISAH